MKKSELELGNIVYKYSDYYNCVIRGIVTYLLPCTYNGKEEYECSVIFTLKCDENGEKSDPIHYEIRCFAEDLWSSAKEALDDRNRKIQELTNYYLGSIKDIKDFITFPLHHDFHGTKSCNSAGENETLKAVLEAYKIKAKELFDIAL